MKKSWANLNVNLSSLVRNVIRFFESNKFNDVTALKTQTGYEVVAGDSGLYKIENKVSVTIDGNPDDFTISLTSLQKEKTIPVSPLLTAMFGGGYLIVKQFRSEEAMRKLERDFSEKIDALVKQSLN